MSIKGLLLTCCTMVLFSLTQTGARAQGLLQMVLKGNSWTTDANGHIAASPVNNQTLLREFANANNISDPSTLALAYHIGGSDLGDTIEVINRANGASLGVLFGLYFGEDFGRTALLSGSGRQLKRLEYIYTNQNSHSLGSALLTTYYFLDDNGHTNSTSVFGPMQYIVTPDGSHPNTKVVSANIFTHRPFQFNP